MTIEERKLSFEEAWNSTTVFFLDKSLEDEIDEKVEELVKCGENERVSETADINLDDISNYIREKENGLDVILKDIGLSQEKFMRIISLLRKLSKIPGEFDSEWNMGSIKRRIRQDNNFAKLIADLLIDGKRDVTLKKYIPRYYLEKLNYREIKGSSKEHRRVKYKESLIGTYGGRKGSKVEERIERELINIKEKYGVNYGRGTSRIINTKIDFAIPGTEDPWVIIMVSFMETTSSDQSTKTRDMSYAAYQRIHISNKTHGENRAFVNFADGGGWLARKNDFKRLVSECHYFLNFEHLNMLEDIIKQHVPKLYFKKT